MKLKIASALSLLSLVAANAAPINSILPSSLTGSALITFDDVVGGSAPGANYNAIFESNGADFAERFVGQTLSSSGGFDILGGSPTGSLALQVGLSGQNLNVFVNGSSQVLTGLGPLGFPDFGAIGEGSFAVLFDFDQAEFGFDLVGGGGGSATVGFYRRDGSLIDTIVLSGLSDQSYAFSREGGVHDIAGISVFNTDPAGIGFDNLRHDVQGVEGPGNPVPEPATILGGAALAVLAGFRAARRSGKR